MWLAVHTRPDIVYLVGVQSCYCSNSGSIPRNLVIQIFRYLSGNLDLRITFTTHSENDLVSYADSDYARTIDGQKFTGSYIFMLSSGSFSHQSKLQNIVGFCPQKPNTSRQSNQEKKPCRLHNFWLFLDFAYLVNLSIYVQIIKEIYR